jgi:hypothetical protein
VLEILCSFAISAVSYSDCIRCSDAIPGGIRVIRFRNQELDEDIWGVVDEIKRALEQSPSPALPTKGEGAEQGK